METIRIKKYLDELIEAEEDYLKGYDDIGESRPRNHIDRRNDLLDARRDLEKINKITTSQQQTIERLSEHLNHLYGEYADKFFDSMKHPIDTEHCKAAFKAKIKLIQKDLVEQLLNTTEPIDQ